MPTAVTYVLAYAASTAGVAIGSAVLTAAGYIITAAAVIGIANNQRRKARRRAIDAYNAGLQDRLVMVALADGRRSRVYGRVRNVDGVVFKQTHGANKEFYTLVISLAGHEVDAIEDVYFGDTKVTLDGSGYVQTEPWSKAAPVDRQVAMTVTAGAGSVVLTETPISGSVAVVWGGSSGALDEQSYSITPTIAGLTVSVTGAPVDGTWYVSYQVNQNTPMARVRKYLGGPSQDLYSDLSAVVGTDLLLPTDKFAGDASLIVTLQYDQDVFPTGVPQISAVIRGAKVLDPRTGTTAWTENPALIARDWALYAYGGGASSDEIVEAALMAAANACDVSTSFVTDAGTEVRPLYQCGIVCPLDADPSLTLGEIVESMAGQWGWVGGRLTLRAGVYRAPVAAIDSSWITDKAAIELVAQAPTSDLVNVMRPTLADAAQDYVPAPTAEVRYTAAITADGRELPREVEYNGVTRAVHAQHISGVVMREAREALTVKLPCDMRAIVLELFDVVTVTLPTFGWVAKEFEVLGWNFSLDGGVLLNLRETSAAIFNLDTGLATLDVAANTLLPKPWEVEQITGVTITSGTTSEVDKSILVRTTVSWTAAVAEAVRRHGRIEVQYTRAGATLPSGDWPSVEAPGDATSVTITGLGQGVHYLFRVRAKTNLGVRGKWSVTKTSQNATVPLLGTDGLAANAATEIIKNAGTSATIGGRKGVPNTAPVRWTTFSTISFTATFTGSVTLNASGEAQIDTAASGSGEDFAYFAVSIDNDTIVSDNIQRFTDLQIGFSKSLPVGFAMTRTFSVTAGNSYTFKVRGQGQATNSTIVVQNYEFKLEAIKR